LLTTIGLTPGGSSIVHIYTQTIHRTAQLTTWKASWDMNAEWSNQGRIKLFGAPRQ